MIIEKDNFIPDNANKPDSDDLVEYGLHSELFLNFITSGTFRYRRKKTYLH